MFGKAICLEKFRPVEFHQAHFPPSASDCFCFKHPLSAKTDVVLSCPKQSFHRGGSTAYEPPLVPELLTGLRSPASVPSLRNCVWQHAVFRIPFSLL
ncbi:hypothetical protein CDAR_182281 [Caerostris darwini]|uniref:Uncharacterized protein n=1 Tax=Caerostris darwini TaxID=1538125 RepID=A0AAV4U5E0_9ARAC|nr:hypothetical protein CDAR_182281 [Caerostris darwini]